MGFPIFRSSLIALALSAVLLGHVPNVWAIPVDPSTLEKEIESGRALVPEFQQIAQEAQRRGLRVFLAGGFAASFGDFSKHQVLSKTGVMNIAPDRLKPVLENIVLPAQDLDLVVTRADGTPESAQEVQDLKTWLETNLPQDYANKTRWDMNGLKTPLGPRPAWSGDPDFARQNNDSLSLGLIELTQPPAGQSVVSEAGHVAKSSDLFLKDLAGDELHFLVSPHHSQTTRAAQGINPEILGAIRVLTKAFQFDKNLPPNDLREISRIVTQFNPQTINSQTYVRNWILSRGNRLVSHAYDPEKALAALDQLGLRQKLTVFDRAASVHSLAWWMNKAPLRLNTKPGVFHSAQTAQNLGIQILEHATTQEAARQITWRYDGIPRAFISRPGTAGEAANYGEGLYLKIPGQGGWATKGNVPVYFSPSGSAVNGVDFDVVQNGASRAYRWHSASTLQVHPQSYTHAIQPCQTTFAQLAPPQQSVVAPRGPLPSPPRRAAAAPQIPKWTHQTPAAKAAVRKTDLALILGGPGILGGMYGLDYLNKALRGWSETRQIDELRMQIENVKNVEQLGELNTLAERLDRGKNTDEYAQFLGAASDRFAAFDPPPKIEDAEDFLFYVARFQSESSRTQLNFAKPFFADLEQKAKSYQTPDELLSNLPDYTQEKSQRVVSKLYWTKKRLDAIINEAISKMPAQKLSDAALADAKNRAENKTPFIEELLQRGKTYEDFKSAMDSSQFSRKAAADHWISLLPRLAKLNLSPTQIQEVKTAIAKSSQADTQARDEALLLKFAQAQLDYPRSLAESIQILTPAYSSPSDSYLNELTLTRQKQISKVLANRVNDLSFLQDISALREFPNFSSEDQRMVLSAALAKSASLSEFFTLDTALTHERGDFQETNDPFWKLHEKEILKFDASPEEAVALLNKAKHAQVTVILKSAFLHSRTASEMLPILEAINKSDSARSETVHETIAESVPKFVSLKPTQEEYLKFYQSVPTTKAMKLLVESELSNAQSVDDLIWILSPLKYPTISSADLASIWAMALPKIRELRPTDEQWKKLHGLNVFPR